MNNKTISAKPGAALPAPLSPPGAAFEIDGKTIEALRKRTQEVLSDVYAGSEFPGLKSALPVCYVPGGTKTPPRYVADVETLNRSVDFCAADFATYVRDVMNAADNLAAKIDVLDTSANVAAETIGTQTGGRLRDEIIFGVLSYPRIDTGTSVKIGALHVLDNTGVDNGGCDDWSEYLAKLDAAARRAFDRLAGSFTGYLERLAEKHRDARSQLNAARYAFGGVVLALENDPRYYAPLIVEALRKFYDRIDGALSWIEKPASARYYPNDCVSFFEALRIELIERYGRDYSTARDAIRSTARDVGERPAFRDVFARYAASDRQLVEKLLKYFTNYRAAKYPGEVRAKARRKPAKKRRKK